MLWGSVGACVLAVSACGAEYPENQRQVSRAEYGEKWPLTVNGGIVRCE
jgi:hypothetical protein